MKKHNYEAMGEGSQDPIPEIELPALKIEQPGKGIEQVDEKIAAKAVEQVWAGLPAPVVGGAHQQTQAPSQQSPQTGLPAPLAGSLPPAIADDNDLIEKEWVAKAKQIVSSTKNDPHLQNVEMNRYKATYIKKRYNKDIKLAEM